MKVVSQTLYLCGRVLRNLSRQPIWIVVMVVQPMFWLLLYSQLFRRITELPGFGTTSYIDYLTPGVAIMTAFFSGSWAGMGMIEDLDRGVLERFLATPASRGAIVFGRILESAIVATLQALLILLTGILLGATNGGAVGWFVILLASFLTAAGFAGLSHGIALRTRQEATMIAVAQFIGLPLLFFSSLLIARSLIPSWMQDLSLLNPVEWAVRSRAARRSPAPTGARWACFYCFWRVRGADDGVRDGELPRLPEDALADDRRPRRPRSLLSDASRGRRGTEALSGGTGARWVATDSPRRGDSTRQPASGCSPAPPTAMQMQRSRPSATVSTPGLRSSAPAAASSMRSSSWRAAGRDQDPGTRRATPMRLDPVVSRLACSLYGESRTVTPVPGTRFASICGSVRSTDSITAATASIPPSSSRSNGPVWSSGRPLRMQGWKQSSCPIIRSSSQPPSSLRWARARRPSRAAARRVH